ncbi:MAG TPA: hypothetical protein IAB49_03330 [Candidatus Caccenecus avistercoris]|nr:hypothetical protein [Candidatus Caccenecus avistercoris]
MNKENFSLGELVFEIGCLLKKYELSNAKSKNERNLLKTKEVLEQYPLLTQYGLEQAIKEEKIPVIKRGRLNFYDSRDIEKYIDNQKTTGSDCISEKIKYV